jgi:hypothetical protein
MACILSARTLVRILWRSSDGSGEREIVMSVDEQRGRNGALKGGDKVPGITFYGYMVSL